MINLRLPAIVCDYLPVTILRACEIRSQCLFRSAEITEAISLALHSVLHGFENFSGFTGFS